MKHLITAKTLTRQDIEAVIERALSMEAALAKGKSDLLAGKIMAALFFEPSTRTRLSFETAMLRLGGSVVSTENAGEFSSAIKGETLEDTIRVLCGYVDAIVLRHHEIGAAARAASVSSVPVLSAGDGAGEHPSQALLDTFTIAKELGKIDNLTIALVGDLLYGRTVHSLVYTLSQFRGIRFLCAAPKHTPLPDDLVKYARAQGASVEFEPELARVAEVADVLYQTRIQKERFLSLDEYEVSKGQYIVDETILRKMKPASIIMHPLPRLDEIAPAVDRDPRAAYFRQTHYGVPVRMALLFDAIKGNGVV